MLSEFVKTIAEQARGADAVQIVELKGDPRAVLIRHGGELKERGVPPPLRSPRTAFYADFLAIVRDAAICEAPEVYYDFGGAFAYCDGSDRRDAVRFPFAVSQRWKALERCAGAGLPLAPKDAIAFLKYELGADASHPLVVSLRKVDFKRITSGSATTERKREGFGMAVEAEVQGVGEIPESFTATLNPFTTRGLELLTVSAEVGVEIDTENARIVLRLPPDTIERAKVAFLVQLGDAFKTDLSDVPCFCGSPS